MKEKNYYLMTGTKLYVGLTGDRGLKTYKRRDNYDGEEASRALYSAWPQGPKYSSGIFFKGPYISGQLILRHCESLTSDVIIEYMG